MVSLTIHGLEDLEQALRNLGREASDKIRLEALKEAAEPMALRMSQEFSRSTDSLHAADYIEIAQVRELEDGERLGPHQSAVALGPAKRFFYTYFIEYGTKHIAPRGEVRRAYDETCRAVPDDFGEAAWRRIRSVL